MKQVMIVSSFHMAGSQDLQGADYSDHIRQVQDQMTEVVERLSHFQPTKVMVEMEKKYQEQLDTWFHRAQAGKDDSTNEIAQLAFPLAVDNQARLLAIDWMEEGQGLYGMGDVAEVWETLPEVKAAIDAYTPREVDLQASILENLRYLNSPEVTAQNNSLYANVIRVRKDGEDFGIGWLIWWYQRNMTIVANILEQLEDGDRAILLIGAAHKGILERFLADTQQVEIVDVLAYL